MIHPTPQWTFAARHELTQWYGHVHLLPDHALGQWFCVDRHTGTPLWERTFSRPNTVSGVADGVVVATETVSFGPGTWTSGCYGISLSDGRLLWTSHADGPRGCLLRLLDRLWWRRNDGRDAPSAVTGGECLCKSGRVLSVQTGRCIRRVSREDVRAGERNWFHEPESDAEVLYRSRFADPRHRSYRVRVEGVGWLTHRGRPGERVRDGFRLYATDDGGGVFWTFDLAATGCAMSHCNNYAYRLAGRHVYVVASEEPSMKPDPAREGHILPNPTTFHLLTVELAGGTVVQDVRVTDRPVADCRIEDVDERAVLVSVGRRELKCYRQLSA